MIPLWQDMKIAIDESGDTGRKIWKGSSRWFVVAAVVVPDSIDGCGLTCSAVSDYQRQYMGGRELHFAHNTHEEHEAFFEYMKDKEYVFAAVAMDKVKLLHRRPYIFKRKATILQACLDELFTELKPWLDNPIVLLDTNGPGMLNRMLTRHLLRYFGARHKGDIHSLKQVRYVDSRDEPLVQLADYVAGATRHFVDKKYVSRSYEKYLSNRGKILYMADRHHR